MIDRTFKKAISHTYSLANKRKCILLCIRVTKLQHGILKIFIHIGSVFTQAFDNENLIPDYHKQYDLIEENSNHYGFIISTDGEKFFIRNVFDKTNELELPIEAIKPIKEMSLEEQVFYKALKVVPKLKDWLLDKSTYKLYPDFIKGGIPVKQRENIKILTKFITDYNLPSDILTESLVNSFSKDHLESIIIGETNNKIASYLKQRNFIPQLKVRNLFGDNILTYERWFCVCSDETFELDLVSKMDINFIISLNNLTISNLDDYLNKINLNDKYLNMLLRHEILGIDKISDDFDYDQNAYCGWSILKLDNNDLLIQNDSKGKSIFETNNIPEDYQYLIQVRTGFKEIKTTTGVKTIGAKIKVFENN